MKHNFSRFHYDSGAGGAGGNLPLHQIMNDDFNPGRSEGVADDGVTLLPGYVRNPITGAVSKDPNYKDPNPIKPNPNNNDDLPEYVDEKDGVDEKGELKPGFLREDGSNKIYKDKNYQAPAPKDEPETGLNEDGTLKPGYKKDDQGNVIEDPDYEGDGDEDDDDESGEKFIGAVEAITGIKYEIEYPEGVIPTTPEGIAYRESKIREHAKLEFEQELATNDPRSYAYMLHRLNGGTDEEFLGGSKGFQLPDVATLKASADLQAAVYKNELLSKGLDDEAVQALLDKATKDNTLEAKALAAHTKMEADQKAQLAQLQADQEKANKQFTADKTAIFTAINNAIKTEIGFVVPEAEQAAFVNFVHENLRYDNGKFYLVQQMDPANNLKVMLESLFLQHKKGDLKTIISKKAKTEAAQTLRLKVKSAGGGPGSTKNTIKTDPSNLPLSAII